MDQLIKDIKEGKYGEITFAIMKVQNPYSSGDRGVQFGWCSDMEYDSVKDFKKTMTRRLENLARKYFVDIMKGGGTAKYYSHLKVEKFLEDYQKQSGHKPAIENLF